MANTSVFGSQLCNVGRVNLNYSTENLVLVNIVEETSFLALITNMQVSRNEIAQPISCFNDFTHIYLFGSQPIQGALSGFTIGDGGKLGSLVEWYRDNYRAYKGKPINIFTKNGEILKGLLISFTYIVNAEAPALANFSMDFIGLDSNDTFLVGS